MKITAMPFLAPAILLSLSALNVQAQDADGAAPQDGLTVGLAAHNAPDYSGSDARKWSFLPVIQGRSGAFFIDTQKGIGYDLQAPGGIYFEQALGYTPGRTDKKSDWQDGDAKLKGMGSINGVMNTSFALGWQATPWLSMEARTILPLTDSLGVQYQASVTGILLQNASDVVALQGELLFGDARYNNTFYGVTSSQSQRSGYDKFTTGGGLYGESVSLSWNHQYSTHWGSSLSTGYTHLTDKISDSPIVLKDGGVDTTLAVTYSF